MVKEFFLKMAPKQPPEREELFEDIEKGPDRPLLLKTADIQSDLQCHGERYDLPDHPPRGEQGQRHPIGIDRHARLPSYPRLIQRGHF